MTRRIGSVGSESGKKICVQPSWSSGGCAPCLCSVCVPEFEAGIQPQIGGGMPVWHESGLWDAQEAWIGGEQAAVGILL